MMWLDIVLKGVSTVVAQWMGSGEEERKTIEARVLDAVTAMLSDGEITATAHDERTAATVAAIAKARGAMP